MLVGVYCVGLFFLFCFQIISVITDLTFQYDWLALLNKLLNSITGVFFHDAVWFMYYM